MSNFSGCVICGMEDKEVKRDLSDNSDEYIILCPTCGKYVVDGIRAASRIDYTRKAELELKIISGYVRNEYENGHVTKLDAIKIEEISDLRPQPKNFLDTLDLLMLHISQKKPRKIQDRVVLRNTDYSLIYEEDFDGLLYCLDKLKDIGDINFSDTSGSSEVSIDITIQGWKKIIELRRETQKSSGKVFVAMSFANELEEIWMNGIRPAIEKNGYIAERVDSIAHNEKIDAKIISDIKSADFLIADVTNQSPGVYFEAGFAIGLGKPVIWSCKESEIGGCHFDTRQYNHVLWDTPENLKEKLYYQINATIGKIKKI